MPSSPEILSWQLEELHPGTMPPALARSVVAAAEARGGRAAVFELSTSAGIPAELLIGARDAARSVGYAAGWSSGIQEARRSAEAEAEAARAERQQADSAHAARLRQAMGAIDRAAAALETRLLPTAEEFEELILSAALAIAEELVGHVLRDDEARSRGVLAHALSLVPEREDVQIRLHPADHAVLVADAAEAVQAATRSVTLIADPSLQPGDAIARCGATEIDARILAGIARVREVLGQ